MKIDAQDIIGKKFAFNLTGLPARVFQHEYDHLQVVLLCVCPCNWLPKSMKQYVRMSMIDCWQIWT